MPKDNVRDPSGPVPEMTGVTGRRNRPSPNPPLSAWTPVIALAVATVYGVGWVCETLMFRDRSVGVISVSHEMAVAGGMSAMVCLLPGILAGFLSAGLRRLDLKDQAAKPLLVGLVVGPVVTLLLLYYLKDHKLTEFQTAMFPHDSFVTSLALDLLLSFVLYVLVVLTRLAWQSTIWRLPSLAALSILLLGFVIGKLDNFSNNILSCLACGYGGFLAQDQHLGIEDKTHGVCGLDFCEMRAFVLARDSDTVLLAHGYLGDIVPGEQDATAAAADSRDADTILDPSHGRIFSIPLSNIVWMRQPSHCLPSDKK